VRTTAGKRGETYTARAAVLALEKWFDRDRAVRIVAIAGTFGIKAEALPKGMVTVRLAGWSGYTIEVDE